jgi:hypothetical protein
LLLLSVILLRLAAASRNSRSYSAMHIILLKEIFDHLFDVIREILESVAPMTS